jgi:hypothetical protein
LKDRPVQVSLENRRCVFTAGPEPGVLCGRPQEQGGVGLVQVSCGQCRDPHRAPAGPISPSRPTPVLRRTCLTCWRGLSVARATCWHFLLSLLNVILLLGLM